MKKTIALLTTAVVLLTGANLYAHDGDHAAPKTEKKQPMCCMVVGELNKSELPTKEQKAKIAELHKACATAGCTEDAQKAFFKDVKALFTPEQIKACYADCEKNDRKGCPICGYGVAKAAPQPEMPKH